MYSIRFVDDSALPNGHDFVFVQADEDYAIFFRESAISPQMLEDAWAAYRALDAAPPPPISLRSAS